MKDVRIPDGKITRLPSGATLEVESWREYGGRLDDGGVLEALDYLAVPCGGRWLDRLADVADGPAVPTGLVADAGSTRAASGT